jgi:hypothetical protein
LRRSQLRLDAVRRFRQRQQRPSRLPSEEGS